MKNGKMQPSLNKLRGNKGKTHFKSGLSRHRFPLLLIIIALVSLGYFVPKYGLIYDGGLYASLGRSIAVDGSYTFNGLPGDVPPIYPITLSFFILLFGERGIFLVTPLFSILFAVGVYLLFKRKFDEDIAFLSSLLIFYMPPIFFYSIQVVRDIPLMTFVVFSYLVYLKNDRDLIDNLLLGLLVGLAFLTKYAALVYVAPLLVHGIFRQKFSKTNFISFFTFILPWIVWSHINHSILLVSHSTYLYKDIGSGIEKFFTFLLPLIIDWSFAPLFLLAIVSLIMVLKKDPLDVYALLFLFTMAIGAVWPEIDTRYILLSFVSIVYLAIIFLSKYNKKHIVTFLLIALTFQIFASYNMAQANTYNNYLFTDAGKWLRQNTSENTVIMAHSYRQINYFSNRKTVQPPLDVAELERYLEHYAINYVVVDSYEKYTPSYMYNVFDNSSDTYRLVITFSRGSDEIKIYSVR